MIFYSTESRTFVGEPASLPGSGYAGFVVGTTYRVRFCRQANGTVLLAEDATQRTEAVVVSEGLFERWWVRPI